MQNRLEGDEYKIFHMVGKDMSRIKFIYSFSLNVFLFLPTLF